MGICPRRREFIAGRGGLAARGAQQGDRVRRIGVLIGGLDQNDSLAKTYVSAFTQALADLGWTDGRNVRMDLRWGGADADRIRALARELVGLQPDIILANTTLSPGPVATPPMARKICLLAATSRELRCQCPFVTPASLGA